MKVFIEKENKRIEKSFNGKAKDLIKEVGVNPETVIIVKNNELITEEDSIEDSDEIKLLSVVSGG